MHPSCSVHETKWTTMVHFYKAVFSFLPPPYSRRNSIERTWIRSHYLVFLSCSYHNFSLGTSLFTCHHLVLLSFLHLVGAHFHYRIGTIIWCKKIRHFHTIMFPTYDQRSPFRHCKQWINFSHMKNSTEANSWDCRSAGVPWSTLQDFIIIT